MSDNDKYRVEIVKTVRPDSLYSYETLASKDITLHATDDQLLSMYMAEALQKMYCQAVTAGILAAREQAQEDSDE